MEILDNEDSIYVFYVTKELYESGFHEKHRSVGGGPLFYNKNTGELKNLGSWEFIEQHLSKDIFKNRDQNNLKGLEEIISDVKKRKHVNSDEWEFIMVNLNIEFDDVNYETDDLVHLNITSKNLLYIELLKGFIERTGLNYVQESPNKIVLYNDAD
ncbi:hypothetical protein MYP_3002 [Sporocytophaga myxococcoides]|uniref:Uncharacterized protein n=2 Tax=Sporocytophaga myxococcoides TaxID=153721 RepID=A0A098LIB9_9BACT|nr:hypothetical protein MYP_3002 [Sporocytophaga myxococcoides]